MPSRRIPRPFGEKWKEMATEKGCCRSELLSDWFPATHPVHNLTMAIAERIYPEILSQRIPPTQPLGTRALLLP